jgi:hypothetical protein
LVYASPPYTATMEWVPGNNPEVEICVAENPAPVATRLAEPIAAVLPLKVSMKLTVPVGATPAEPEPTEAVNRMLAPRSAWDTLEVNAMDEGTEVTFTTMGGEVLELKVASPE